MLHRLEGTRIYSTVSDADPRRVLKTKLRLGQVAASNTSAIFTSKEVGVVRKKNPEDVCLYYLYRNNEIKSKVQLDIPLDVLDIKFLISLRIT